MHEPSETIAAITMKIEEAVTAESRTVTRCLVAAERAIEEGQFACAKVLRVAAHSSRRRAIQLQRLLGEMSEPLDSAAEAPSLIAEERRRRATVLLSLPPGPEAIRHRLMQIDGADRSLRDLLERAVVSLETHRDIVESDVALSLFGCPDCGRIVEERCPDICPYCGAFGVEFAVFSPFYVATPDRLGRRRSPEIVAILAASPARLAAALADVDEADLRHQPSVEEWSMKEIAGHLIDITNLLRNGLRGETAEETKDLPPWKILEIRNYNEADAGFLIAEFTRVTNEVVALLGQLTDADWTRPGDGGERHGNLLDAGTWLANHNIAHLKQLEARRAQRAVVHAGGNG